MKCKVILKKEQKNTLRKKKSNFYNMKKIKKNHVKKYF